MKIIKYGALCLVGISMQLYTMNVPANTTLERKLIRKIMKQSLLNNSEQLIKQSVIEYLREIEANPSEWGDSSRKVQKIRTTERGELEYRVGYATRYEELRSLILQLIRSFISKRPLAGIMINNMSQLKNYIEIAIDSCYQELLLDYDNEVAVKGRST